jgi:hypothetical protein
MWKPAPYRSVKEIIHFLVVKPFRTESEIQEQVFGYYRNYSNYSNKKYADMLRRGLEKGVIKRIYWKRKNDSRPLYRYYVPTSANINM